MRQVNNNSYTRTAGENALLIGGIILVAVGIFFLYLIFYFTLVMVPIGAFMIYWSGRCVNRVRKQAEP
jgi:hypothetical protein